MMYLTEAIRALESSFEINEYGPQLTNVVAVAQAYAAIAQVEATREQTIAINELSAILIQYGSKISQAEALTRIADYLEGYAAIYLDPAVVSVAEERQKNRS